MDRFTDIRGTYDKSPLCSEGHPADSVMECSAGIMGCDSKVFCHEHLTRCVGCERAFCQADAARLLDGDLCEACAGLPECPNCGKHATFTEHEADHVETHGLDCGPYERWHQEWITCDACGAETDWDEVNRANERTAA